jgi:hypothetical protein
MSGRDRAGRARSGPVVVRAVGPRSVEFVGPRVLEGMQALGITYMRSRFSGGWLVPQYAAEDLMAWLEGVSEQRIEVSL